MRENDYETGGSCESTDYKKKREKEKRTKIHFLRREKAPCASIRLPSNLQCVQSLECCLDASRSSTDCEGTFMDVAHASQEKMVGRKPKDEQAEPTLYLLRPQILLDYEDMSSS